MHAMNSTCWDWPIAQHTVAVWLGILYTSPHYAISDPPLNVLVVVFFVLLKESLF